MASARELLDSAYDQLGLREGELVDAAHTPTGVSSEAWIDKGEWLSLANSVGVEKVFFVQDNPVLVFATAAAKANEEIRLAVNSIWCMARPQCLFFALPGELLVFDLTRPPIGPSESLDDHNRLLRRVTSIADVQEQLANYRRELLESGNAPEGQGYFSPGEARADKALIRDLKAVRESLMDAGLDGEKATFANSLIGRSIFIRYLEDRRILLESDFRDVAESREEWLELLESSQGVPIEPSLQHIRYTKLLSNKAFTYAFFKKLSRDFNGDLFPVTTEEENAITPAHLRLLQRFLRAEIADPTKPLFFFAYRFEIIPIELISSIYEEFYNAERGRDRNHGTHYTPIELVEYLLSKALTPELLAKDPTVLDPACGSGIFLVEAFRRIVRYRQTKHNRRLGLPELRKIIRDQLRGIDINSEAIRVAAFSLYLALLHHLEPPDIWREKRLPHLTYDPEQSVDDVAYFNILVAANSFSTEEIIRDPRTLKTFESGCIDVVVGNPPWGYPKRTDEKGLAAARGATQWCQKRDLSIGDKELSQAFIHRAIDFLRPDGRAAMLVSTGVFFKHQTNSTAFRRQWLSRCQLEHVVNFSTVRQLYFNRGVAPFASIVFSKVSKISPRHVVEYWSAKHTLQAKQMRAVVLSLADRRVISQYDALNDDRVWKTYWWGNHHDHALISALQQEDSLLSIVGRRGTESNFGLGFQASGSDDPPEWLSRLRVLPTANLVRYGELLDSDFEPPPEQYRARGGIGPRCIFEQDRLIIKRGVSQAEGQNGWIVSRLETEPFAFHHSAHGVCVESLPKWKAKVILGITWSSLARYFLWLTAGGWGMWHHELLVHDIQRIPIRFPNTDEKRRKLVRIVDTLRASRVSKNTLLDPAETAVATMSSSKATDLEQTLNEIVFDIYGLSEAERSLVGDMCEHGLDLFYRHADSNAVKRLRIPEHPLVGLVSDLESSTTGGDLTPYLLALVRRWNQELHPNGEFAWSVIMAGKTSAMVAVVLQTTTKRKAVEKAARTLDWDDVLQRLDQSSLQPVWSRRIYIDGVIRAVGETDVIIIKRNERRLWTASMAREDAEATIMQAMQLQESL